MPSELDRFFEMQKTLQTRYEQISPTSSFKRAMQSNIGIMDSVINPYKNILASVDSAARRINDPLLESVERLRKATELSIPDLSKDWVISASVFESLQLAEFKIPEYLYDFPDLNRLIQDRTNDLVDSMNSLLGTFTQESFTIEKIPSHMISPVVSSSTHLITLERLHYYDYELCEEPEEDLLYLIDSYSAKAEEKIQEINSDWLVLLDGAKEALCSNNPDKIRHAITSLRELITQIIHFLAPDEEIKEKYTDKAHYHNNRPTRRTRLHYIVSRKNSDTKFLKLVNADIDACLELFNLYQKGTHEVISSLCDEDLLLIAKRTMLIIEHLL